MNHHLRALSLLLLLPLGIWGQSDFRRIGLEEGLPTLAINSVEEGPQGFVWMASEGAGLLRYDGYRFESFFIEDFPFIEKLERSWRGERLYFHNGRRLVEFDGLELKEITLPDDSRFVDLCNRDGELYVTTLKALYYWDGDSLHFKTHLPQGTKKVQVLTGNLVSLVDTILYRFEEQPGRFVAIDTGQITIPEGTPEMYLKGSKWQTLGDASALDVNSIPQTDSLYASYQSKGNLLLLDSDEIIFSQKAGDKAFELRRNFSAYFQVSEVRSIQVLKNQILILSSKGVFIMESPGMNFARRQMPIMGLELGVDDVFTATPMGIESMAEKQIFGFKGLVLDLLAAKDSLWVATESGLFLRTSPPESQVQSSNVEGFVFSLGSGSGFKWAASSSGIWRQEEGLSWDLMLDAEEIDFASIFSIRHHSESGFWFASYTQGLWQFKEGKWQHYTQLGGIPLDSIGISAIQPLSEQKLAIGTLNSGLYIIDLQTAEALHLAPKALDFAEIRDFALDQDQLWMGTNKGLISLIDVSESAKAGESARPHFFGLPVNQKCLELREGVLYSAGDQGMFSWELEPYFRLNNQGDLGLLEAGFLRQEQQEDEAQFERLPFSGLRLLSDLDHDANYLRFRFGTRSLHHPDWVQYRYRLLGQNNEWTYSGTVREALFSDLKAGNYTLEVEARYPWQNWSMQTVPYVFTIREAIWRTWWFWSAIILALGGLSFMYFRERWNQREERLKLENDLLEMERKALRLQMNPHFIFNALDSISSFIFKQDPKMAVRYLNNFAKLMRLTLESSMEHIHPVETEVSILKNYLELEKLRFNSKFEYEIEVDEELDYDIGLPPMLIQPHVENAILHGLKPKEGKGFLALSFKLEGTKLCCTIEDDGIGREAAKDLPNKKAHRSMATQINKDRIDLLKRSMNEVIDLKIIDKYNQQGQACGTKVIIRLPAQEL